MNILIKFLAIPLLSIGAQLSFAQVVKDLDGDGIKDTVTFDMESGTIICKLSTQKFLPISSKPDLADEMNAGVRATKSGFEFYVSQMRAGYANQFRYEANEKKIRLIGMSRYEFGPANNDGSGKSSINLLTNHYIGEWYHYNLNKSKLIKMPTITTKMYFQKTYLENYNGNPQNTFETKCSELYYKQKKLM